jgi:hypothetical protein
MRRISRWTAAALVFAALSAPGRGLAQEGDLKIVVMSFEGPGAKTVRNSLIKAMSTAEGVDLVSRKEAEATGEKLGIPADTSLPKNLVKIGEQLNLDAIVVGQIVQEKNIKNLEVMVIYPRGLERSVTLNYTWTSKAPPQDLILEISVDIVDGTRDAIKQIESAAAAKIFEPPPPGSGPVEPQPGPRKKHGLPSRRGPVIAFHAGLLVGARKLEITAESGPDVKYDGSAFPAIGLDLEFFPIRLATKSPAADLGLAIKFQHSLALKSRMEGSGTEEFDTFYRRFDVRLLYQLPIKKTPVMLDFSAGWGLLFYQLSAPVTAGLPVVDYQYLRILIGLGARIKAVDPWLAISVGGDIAIPHAWEQAETSYGASASGFGGGVHLGLSGRIVAGLGWSAGFAYTGMMTKHKGTCTSSYCALEAQKSVDHYPFGWVQIGYSW